MKRMVLIVAVAALAIPVPPWILALGRDRCSQWIANHTREVHLEKADFAECVFALPGGPR